MSSVLAIPIVDKQLCFDRNAVGNEHWLLKHLIVVLCFSASSVRATGLSLVILKTFQLSPKRLIQNCVQLNLLELKMIWMEQNLHRYILVWNVNKSRMKNVSGVRVKVHRKKPTNNFNFIFCLTSIDNIIWLIHRPVLKNGLIAC